MDSLLIGWTSVLIIFAAFISLRFERTLFTPMLLTGVAFFLPMIAACFRLSGLQSPSWAFETYVVMFLATIAWLLMPMGMSIANYSVQNRGESHHKPTIFSVESFIRPEVYVICRWVALLVLMFFFLGNVIQAGSPVILHAESLYGLHTDFPFAIRFFARATPLCCMLMYMCYYKNRRWLDAFLLLLVLLVPLTRGARIDIAMSLTALIILFSRYPLVKVTWKTIVVSGLLFVLLIIGGVEFGNQRLNRFGEYEVTYDTVVKWLPQSTGPGMLFPTLYAYFPLSFENFDQAVRQGMGSTTRGFASMDWFLTGFIKANWIPGYASIYFDAKTLNPISGGANVPTALLPFFTDFGAIFCFIPMALTMSFLCYAYFKGKASDAWFMVFALYASAFALTSFQGLLVSPLISQQIAELGLLILLFKRCIIRRDLIQARGGIYSAR